MSAVEPLLKTAMNVIQSAAHHRCLFRLWGTAGMRYLSAHDRNAIFAALGSGLSQRYPNLKMDSKSFQVIMGKMEGIDTLL